MPRRVIRRSENYRKHQDFERSNRMNDSDYGREHSSHDMEDDKTRNFGRNQGEMDNDYTDTDKMVSLLEKISYQLEKNEQDKIQQSGQQSSQSKANMQSGQESQNITVQDLEKLLNQLSANGQQQTSTNQAGQSTQNDSQELQNLFKQLLLKNNNNDGDTTTANTNGQQAQQDSSTSDQGTSKLGTLLCQIFQKKKDGASSGGANQNTQKDKNQKTIAVQTAAQVLAQAQYELSNELEASLKNLKQVISESEKLANNISNLLGEEKNTSK